MAMTEKFTGEVISKEFLTDDTIRLTVASPESFSYRPGQFVIFQIKKGKEAKNRAYSILEGEKKKLHFAIRLLEGGFASEEFRQCRKGSRFELKGPFGQFAFDEKGEAHWFIASGVGMAPLYCMIKKFLPQHPGKKFVLLFGAKTRQDLLFYDELKEMEEKYPGFSYLPTLSREEWAGRTGRVQKHLPNDLQNKTFYLCGLKEMVKETKDLLIEKGVPPERIHFERYS